MSLNKAILILVFLLTACGRSAPVAGPKYVPGPPSWQNADPLPATLEVTLLWGDGCKDTKTIDTYADYGLGYPDLVLAHISQRLVDEIYPIGPDGWLSGNGAPHTYLFHYPGREFAEADSSTCTWNLPESI